MLSSISKLADRNFIVGFILPTLLGAIGINLIINDFSISGAFFDSLLGGDTYKGVAVFALAVWVLSVVLGMLNYRLYRLLEGYLPPLESGNVVIKFINWMILSKWRSRKYKTLYKTEMSWLNTNFGGSDEYLTRSRRKYVAYPNSIELVRSTEFGNAIRAFETYPLEVYKVDAIATWLRLVAVIPKDYVSSIDNAKADVDFWVNTLAVAGVCMCFSIIRFTVSVWTSLLSELTYGPISNAPGSNIVTILGQINWMFLISAAVSSSLIWFAYRDAIDKVKVWGEFVKAAFDLFLPDLAAKMGYQLPETKKGREKFWTALNSVFLDLDPLAPECWLRAVAKDAQAPGSSAEAGEGAADGKGNATGGADTNDGHRAPEIVESERSPSENDEAGQACEGKNKNGRSEAAE